MKHVLNFTITKVIGYGQYAEGMKYSTENLLLNAVISSFGICQPLTEGHIGGLFFHHDTLTMLYGLLCSVSPRNCQPFKNSLSHYMSPENSSEHLNDYYESHKADFADHLNECREFINSVITMMNLDSPNVTDRCFSVVIDLSIDQH